MTHYATVVAAKNVLGLGQVREDVRKVANHRNKLSWVCSGRDAIAILEAIEPYSVTKKEQIKEGLVFKNLLVNDSWKVKLSQELLDAREQCYLRLQELKVR